MRTIEPKGLEDDGSNKSNLSGGRSQSSPGREIDEFSNGSQSSPGNGLYEVSKESQLTTEDVIKVSKESQLPPGKGGLNATVEADFFDKKREQEGMIVLNLKNGKGEI
ncbi:hypothetical protein GLAREA_07287 [Glarea lozoyensis ATCC 20868]|uniref:Uncharacterized protein n=1 Tax=Glarea lozoyensis (strain ATCC 20868 / MF5171) TaxID=1116229 RepID=S3D4X6_GLAL2|nr:uncharacterized protein GLAREA_07287 [Glarea lozoyensis ATCC 20868]EPE32154.1 hypothetical protein GLAREA_07287 [Glarea lozoyensis ATCC 20868]